MKITPWKIAAVVVFAGALVYRVMFSASANVDSDPPEPQPPIEKRAVENTADKKTADGDQEQQAADLLHRIDDARERMREVGKRFGVAIRVAMTDDQPDDGEVRKEWQLALDEIREIRSGFQEKGDPTLKSARNLAHGYVEYLDWQEQTYLKDYGQMVVNLERSDLSPLEKQNAVKAVFTERSGDEQQRDAEIQKLRQAVFDDFKSKVKTDATNSESPDSESPDSESPDSESPTP